MSTTSTLYCRDDSERRSLARAALLNGLDYLEVSDEESQPHLKVYFLGKAPDWITAKHLHIDGGRRIRDLRVIEVKVQRSEEPDKDDVMIVTVDRRGDYSNYTLSVVSVDEEGKPTGAIPVDFDPRYAQLCFTFNVDCPSDLDCKPTPACVEPPAVEPVIDYVAKDYASFRRLILDRLALIMPAWKERHVPDLEITLVELLAYVGDYLSYYQDAVATEAYLDTARKRISVRRHVRLVDYYLHEGCNARTWVTVDVANDVKLLADTFYFITTPPNLPGIVLKETQLENLQPDSYLVFEPLLLPGTSDIQLYKEHGTIHFYTWGESECCLPKGSTSATLIDPGAVTQASPVQSGQQRESKALLNNVSTPGNAASNGADYRLQLKPGDVLLVEEVKSPTTGNAADADRSHRHAVRLTQVTPSHDPVTGQLIVEIEWSAEDALPFPLCLSAMGPAPDCRMIQDVSVAHGNVILVDHGARVVDVNLGQVPTLHTDTSCECEGHPGEVRLVAGKFQKQLQRKTITYRAPLPADAPANGKWVAATRLLQQDVRAALPQVSLVSQPQETWESRYDLLASLPEDRHFVIEIDDDGIANLRFGDGELGYRPPAGMHFEQAVYRVGNGLLGNVSAEAISRLVLRGDLSNSDIKTVRNPLPAQGGSDPEPMAEAKLYAPRAFRKKLERAIIAQDYAEIADRNPLVQRAAAALTWTGSWYEADVAIDEYGQENVKPGLLHDIRSYLHRFRRMGHELHVTAARYVPLDIRLEVCALPHYARAHVKAALLEVFSNRVLADGRLGFFHPDNLSFGDGIYLSRIVAVARTVQGLASVRVTRFQRLFQDANHELDNGVIPLHFDEVAQLDNDPSFPEHGKLEIKISGGR